MFLNISALEHCNQNLNLLLVLFEFIYIIAFYGG